MTATSILDEFKASAATSGPSCAMGRILADMTKEDREHTKIALADVTIQSPAIARVLKNRGHTVGNETVRRHRKGSCSCSDV